MLVAPPALALEAALKIDTQGHLLDHKIDGRGVTVVSCEDHSQVVMEIDELSDQLVFNLFLKFPPKARLTTCLQQPPENWDDETDLSLLMTHEVLIPRQ